MKWQTGEKNENGHEPSWYYTISLPPMLCSLMKGRLNRLDDVCRRREPDIWPTFAMYGTYTLNFEKLTFFHLHVTCMPHACCVHIYVLSFKHMYVLKKSYVSHICSFHIHDTMTYMRVCHAYWSPTAHTWHLHVSGMMTCTRVMYATKTVTPHAWRTCMRLIWICSQLYEVIYV